MNHQQTTSIDTGVYKLVADQDRLPPSHILSQIIVVIARRVMNPRASIGQLGDPLQQRPVDLWPMPLPLQCPTIDEVADQKQVFRLMI